ncbi:hypothetical protein ACE38U_16495 [Cedecea sp. S5-13]|jgi:hypothetical protein|uniref:hypothetical protein n=1 Tax=Cedecea selenatireducens TaxID=3144416 RepID=UPI0035CCC875
MMNINNSFFFDITGLLFEMTNALVEDLKAPRFVRTDSGLAMIDSQAGNNLHQTLTLPSP